MNVIFVSEDYRRGYRDGLHDAAKIPDDRTASGALLDLGFDASQTARLDMGGDTAVSFGAKRLPQVGEVWRTRDGALVAVISQASIDGGGYNGVMAAKGTLNTTLGRVIVYDLDGIYVGGTDISPATLVEYVTRFDA